MNTNKENWKDYVVTVGGIEFRPVSMGTLTLLYNIGSPIVMGGDIEPQDYCVFAWMHAAPIIEVFAAVKSGTYLKKAILWGSEVQPVVFASYVPDTMALLASDISKLFIEEKSGFIPFPLPSPCKPSWWKRAIHSFIRLFQRG